MTSYRKKRILVKFRAIKRALTTRVIDKVPPMNDVQLKAFSTIKKLIVKPNSTLLVAPISGSCYIEYKNYFIKFNTTSAIITNSKFSYYIEFNYVHGQKLVEFFNQRVEKRRTALEEKYDLKTMKNLDEIINSLQN